jgi:hypothetical protein
MRLGSTRPTVGSHTPQPSTAADPATYPRSYRLRWVWRIVLCVAAVLLPPVGFMAGVILDKNSHSQILLLFALGFVCAVVLIAYAFECRVTLWPDRIAIRRISRTIEIPRENIVGRWPLGDTETLFWGASAPYETTSLPRFLNSDAHLDSWMGSLPDYRTLRRQTEERDAAADPSLGAMPAERLALLKKGRQLEGLAYALVAVTGAWALFYPVPYDWALLTVCATPWVALVLPRCFGLNRIFGPGRPRPTLAVGVSLVCGMLIALPSPFFLTNIFVLDWQRAVWITVGVAMALTAVFACHDVRLRRPRKSLLVTLIAMCLYSVGAVFSANVFLDDARAEVFNVPVTHKEASGSKLRARRYLKLGPSPREDVALDGEVRVSARFYDAVRVGQSLCINLQPGALGIRWYTIDDCGGPGMW